MSGHIDVPEMNGAQELAGFNLRSVDPSYHPAASNSDFDGDQHGDVLWRNDTTGQNAIWEMAGGPVEKTGYNLRSVEPSWHVGNDGHFFFG